ncbi:hypothetical protein MKW98_024651 [Papaver atlanticum]|uniref:Uncharacterized protein n=1 Tax=Papaver atlanticum TaxID=357466 RepID=A0AAD4S1X4_9MAGN|nr:hypothetical protein MKW98_024651 [Papaver atlanticum]
MSKVLVSLVLFISLCITFSIEAHPFHVPNPSPVALRRLVAVQGYVSCKPCVDVGHDTYQCSSKLICVTVKMICHGKPQDNPLILSAVTDKSRFFFIPPTKKVSEFGAESTHIHHQPTPSANTQHT